MENYKNLNPVGLVPCLITNNNENIHQSLAIIEYLEENYNIFYCLFLSPLKGEGIKRKDEIAARFCSSQ